MIPDGWVLVPMVPTERMLTEFSGVWAPWLPKSRRELELKAYDDMLAVVPSAPPCDGDDLRRMIVTLRRQLYKLNMTLKEKTRQCDKAYNKIRDMHNRIEALENERTNTIHPGTAE